MKKKYISNRVFMYIIMLVSSTLFSAENKNMPECSSPADDTITSVSSKSDTLVVIARCVEIPGRFVPNDAYNYVYVMKYRVIKVLMGSISNRSILVGHYNPLIPRKLVKDKMDNYVDGTVESFTVGDKHRLTLIHPISKVWVRAIETEYYDSPLKTYYALIADTVE